MMPRPGKPAPVISTKLHSNIISKEMGDNNKMKNKNPSSSPAASPDGPPIHVTRSNHGDREIGPFTKNRRITYNIGKRSFSLALKKIFFMGRVVTVEMNILEKVVGKASANLNLIAILDQANAASCRVCSDFNGPVKAWKGNLSSPPLPDTEFLMYEFTDAKSSPSCFVVEKKTKAEYFEKITATHCFPISEDAVYHVAIKIVTSNKGKGLRVKVKGPVKGTNDFMDQQMKKYIGKMERKMFKQIQNAMFGGRGDEDMKLLQSLGGYVNSGVQNQKGLINSIGFFMGFGNGAVFNNCRISPPKKLNEKKN